MRTRESGLRAVRQAAGWHAPRPGSDELRELADLVLAVTIGRDDALARVVHELAAWCRYAVVATAVNNTLPPLGAKELAFRRCFSSRAAWAWLACR